jgi:hypothetical protein
MRIYRAIILPLVLYGYETWSLTIRVEHRLRMFENKVLRRLFGRKRDDGRVEETAFNKELHDLYSPLNIIRMIKSNRRRRWAGHVARRGEKINVYRCKNQRKKDH